MITKRPTFISRNESKPKLNQRLFLRSMRKIEDKEDLEKVRINKIK